MVQITLEMPRMSSKESSIQEGSAGRGGGREMGVRTGAVGGSREGQDLSRGEIRSAQQEKFDLTTSRS